MPLLTLKKPATLCYYCDPDAPCSLMAEHKPCDPCKKEMREKIVLVSKTDEDSLTHARTGYRTLVTDDWVKDNIHPKEVADGVLLRRFAFMGTAIWEAFKLPKKKKVLYCTIVEYLGFQHEVISVDNVYCHAEDAIEAKINTINGEAKGTKFRIVSSAPAIGVYASDERGSILSV